MMEWLRERQASREAARRERIRQNQSPEEKAAARMVEDLRRESEKLNELTRIMRSGRANHHG